MPGPDAIAQTVAEFVAEQNAAADRLLPLLHRVQEAHGCIPETAMADIAQALNVSRAEVFGVVSFYDDFLLEPRNSEVQICGAEACQALGCKALLAEARGQLADVHVREVFCLGNCAVGPSARVGDRVIGRATLAGIRAALGRSR